MVSALQPDYFRLRIDDERIKTGLLTIEFPGVRLLMAYSFSAMRVYIFFIFSLLNFDTDE